MTSYLPRLYREFLLGNGPALTTHSLKMPLYAELSLLLMHVDFTTETLLVKSSFAAVRQEWESHASQIGTSGGKLKAWTHIHFTLMCMQKIHRWIYTLHKMKIVDSQLSLFYLHWLGYCLKISCCWQLKNSEKEKSATEQKKNHSRARNQNQHNPSRRDTCSVCCSKLTLLLRNSVTWNRYLLPQRLHKVQNPSVRSIFLSD